MGSHALDRETFHVLYWLWSRGVVTTKNDFARHHADAIARCASERFITSEVLPGTKKHGRHWRLTPEGLLQFWHYSEQHHKELSQEYDPPHPQDKDSPD